MKKVVSVLLAIFIFAVPLLCFADSLDIYPVLLPVTDAVVEEVIDSPYVVAQPNNLNYRYSASHSEVYLALMPSTSENRYRWIAMSPYPGVNLYSSNGSTVVSTPLSAVSDNGYFYSSGNFIVVPEGTNVPISSFSGTPAEFASTFFTSNSVVFNLSDLVDGSVSWLSAVVDGVLQAPMLLFLILVPFIGIAVGLLFRFRRG